MFGQILTCTKLQSFDSSAYEGNKDLCDYPLPKKCHNDEPLDERLWLVASILLGFISGFWGVCATLLLSRSCRHPWSNNEDMIGYKLYVLITMK